jgi:YVTN family beta-propeller protein
MTGGTRRGIWIGVAAAAAALVLVGALMVPKLLSGKDAKPRADGTRGSTGTDGSEPTGATGETGVTGGLEVFATVVGSPINIDTRAGAVWVTSNHGSAGLLSRIDPTSGEVIPISVGPDPIRVSSDGTDTDGNIWVANHADNTMSKIPLPVTSSSRAQTIVAGDGPFRILSTEGSGVIWVSNRRGATVSIIPTDGGSPRSVNVGQDPTELSSAFHSIWVVNSGSDSVTRLDASTGNFETEITVGKGPTSIQPSDRFLWVANTDGGTVSRIDPTSPSSVNPRITVGSQPTGVTNDREGGIWVRDVVDHTVSRIDERSLEVLPLDVGGTPVAMAVTPGSLWVATADGVLVRIDVREKKIAQRTDLGHTPVSIAAERDQSATASDLQGIWIVNDDGTVLHVDVNLS